MRPTEFDIRIIQAVRAVRELRRVKQMSVAIDLGMSECNYSKIENGYKAISISQLKTISKSLKVSVFLLLALAEAKELVGEKLTPLSEILLNFVQSLQSEEYALTEEEMSFIIAKIKVTTMTVGRIDVEHSKMES